MAPFPLLRLPSVVLKEIIPQLVLAHVFQLTLISSKFERAVQYAKYPVELFTITISNNPTIQAFNEENSMFVTAIFPILSQDRKYRRVSEEQIQIENVRVFDSSSEIAIYLIEIRKDEGMKLRNLESLCDHLLSFLKVQKFNFEFFENSEGFQNLFIWNYTKKLSSVSVYAKVTPEEVEFLSEEVSTRSSNFKFSFDEKFQNYKYQKPFENKKIHITKPSWVNFDNRFIGSNCQHLTFTGAQISTSRINCIIREWIMGEHSQLEELIFKFDGTNPQKDEEFLNMIDWSPTSFTEKQLISRLAFLLPFQTCVDIRRETDGRLATICHNDDYIGLNVWLPKHLEKLSKWDFE